MTLNQPITRGGEGGFTLIEVLLTVVILSVGLVLILRTFLTTLHTLQRTEEAAVVSLLLEEKMEAIKLQAAQEEGLALGVDSGKWAPSKTKTYDWKLGVSPSGVDEKLNEVRLDISWKQGKSPRRLFATTYLENKEEQ